MAFIMGMQQQPQAASQDTVDYSGYLQSSHNHQIHNKHLERQSQGNQKLLVTDLNSSVTSTKGLLNGPGQNNCFLNSAVQATVFHDGNYRCGAVIIDKLWLITAAHCVQESQSSYTVRLGTSHKYYGGEEHKIDKVIRYREKYNKPDDAGYNDDIALIKLDIPIEVKENQTPIPLAKFDDLSAGSEIQISGFGVTSENGIASTILRTAFVPVVKEVECKTIYSHDPLSDRVFCAGYLKTGGVDSCFGDSGGPAVFNGRLIGIVMGGDGCARSGYPGIYTKISAFYDWIMNNVDHQNNQ